MAGAKRSKRAGSPPGAEAASHAPCTTMGLACTRASLADGSDEQTVGRDRVRQPVTAPVLRLVAARKLAIEPSKYGCEPQLSVAAPRKTLSQSQSCSYGPAGTRYG